MHSWAAGAVCVGQPSVLQGAAAAQHANINFVDPAGSMLAWLGTFYHRLPLLNPHLEDIGVGAADAATVCLVQASPKVSPSPAYEAVLWPPRDGTDVPAVFNPAGEYPDPVPQGGCQKCGCVQCRVVVSFFFWRFFEISKKILKIPQFPKTFPKKQLVVDTPLAPTPPPPGNVGMAVQRRRREGKPPGPPPPKDQSDYHGGKKRHLPSGNSDRSLFGAQTFGSLTPALLARTTLVSDQRQVMFPHLSETLVCTVLQGLNRLLCFRSFWNHRIWNTESLAGAICNLAQNSFFAISLADVIFAKGIQLNVNIFLCLFLFVVNNTLCRKLIIFAHNRICTVTACSFLWWSVKTKFSVCVCVCARAVHCIRGFGVIQCPGRSCDGSALCTRETHAPTRHSRFVAHDSGSACGSGVLAFC